MEGWGEACFMGNGFREGQEGDGTGGGGGRGVGGGGKQLQCPPPPPPNLMDNISGEFALVINGHSLVLITRPRSHILYTQTKIVLAKDLTVNCQKIESS